MRAAKISKIKVNGITNYLGENPSGIITEKGDVFTYDNIPVVFCQSEKITAYDEAGEPFDATSIEELIREIDMLDAWEEI